MVASGHGTSAAGVIAASPMLRAWYPMTRPNEPVRLYQGRLALTVHQKTHRVPRSVRLEWLPTPRLMATAGSSAKKVVAAAGNAMFANGDDEGVLTLPLAAVPKPPQGPARSYKRFSWNTDTLLSPVVMWPPLPASMS